LAAAAAPASKSSKAPKAPKPSPPRPRRAPARNRAATEARILQAVGDVLARDGFQALGVNAVAQEAGVDKVLIYRYFGGLPELLQAWGRSGRFWPSVGDLLDREPGLLQRPPAERLARFFDHFIDELRARPVTLAILAAEVSERNALTAILETQREQWGDEAMRVLGGPELAEGSPAALTTLVLVAGVQHLLVRARHIRVYGGIELRSDAAWDEIKAALGVLARQMLAGDARATDGAAVGRP
jgi:AcrR family transcriptional regulator